MKITGTKIRLVYLLLAILGLLLAASIILPTLNRYRRRQYAEATAMNLHQIGLGILIYCNENHGNFPDSLATLVAHTQLSPKCLVDFDSDDTPAKGSTAAEIAAQLAKPGHQTFIYLGAGLTDKTADDLQIIAYEPLTVHENGADALFGDGHCEWLTPDQLKKALSHPPTTQAATQPE
jgi:prepilin-type processing-associated H-X9-DG protein